MMKLKHYAAEKIIKVKSIRNTITTKSKEYSKNSLKNKKILFVVFWAGKIISKKIFES